MILHVGENETKTIVQRAHGPSIQNLIHCHHRRSRAVARNSQKGVLDIGIVIRVAGPPTFTCHMITHVIQLPRLYR